MILGGVCVDGVVLVADRRPYMARVSREPIVKLHLAGRFGVGGARTPEFAQEVAFEVGYELVVGNGSMRHMPITDRYREGEFDEVSGGTATGFLVGHWFEGPTLWHVWPLVKKCPRVKVVGAGGQVEPIARLVWNPKWSVSEGKWFGLWLYGIACRHTPHVGDGADILILKENEAIGPEFYPDEVPEPDGLMSWFADAANRLLGDE